MQRAGRWVGARMGHMGGGTPQSSLSAARCPRGRAGRGGLRQRHHSLYSHSMAQRRAGGSQLSRKGPQELGQSSPQWGPGQQSPLTPLETSGVAGRPRERGPCRGTAGPGQSPCSPCSPPRPLRRALPMGGHPLQTSTLYLGPPWAPSLCPTATGPKDHWRPGPWTLTQGTPKAMPLFLHPPQPVPRNQAWSELGDVDSEEAGV